MKITFQRQPLLHALRVMKSVAPTRSPKAILKNTNIECVNGVVWFSATDLEVGVRMSVEADKIQEGEAIALPADRLFSIVNECPSADFVIVGEEGRATIQAGASRFTLLGESGEDFPRVEEFDRQGSFAVPAATLVDMIHKTLFAVAQEQTRYALNGVYMSVSGGLVEMVGADGRRLAYIKKDIDGLMHEAVNGIVPQKTMRELLRLAQGATGEIRIKLADNRFSACADGMTLVSQLVEGRYPDYKDIIPKDCTTQFSFDREELLVALRQAKLLVGEESSAVVFHFSSTGLELKSSNCSAGEATIACGVEGAMVDLVIGFNPDFLVDGMNQISDKRVSLHVKDASRAGVLQDESDYMYVIMPMRTGGSQR